MILLFGHGSIGRRYEKILNFMNEEVCIVDIQRPDYAEAIDLVSSGDWDKAIIATPTGTHVDMFWRLVSHKKPMLIEKPIAKSTQPIELMRDYCKNHDIEAYMVCNYKFALMGRKPLEWNYYNTGSDGLEWDLIQLLYLNPELKIGTDGFVWGVATDEGRLAYREVEESYFHMIHSFLFQPTNLWDLEDARKATETVLRRIDAENTKR